MPFVTSLLNCSRKCNIFFFSVILYAKQLLWLLGGLQLVGVPFHLWLLQLPKHTTLLRGSCLETRGHWGRARAVLGWTPVKSLWLQGMGCTLQGWQSFTVTICMSEFTSKADTGPATSFHLDFQAFNGCYITRLNEVFNGKDSGELFCLTYVGCMVEIEKKTWI